MMRRLYILLFVIACFPRGAWAHQAPYTNILLDVNTRKVSMELQIPVPELALAFGQEILVNPATIVERYGDSLRAYLAAHVHAYTDQSRPWRVEVVGMSMDRGTQALSGPPFWELRAHIDLVPGQGEDTRRFFLDYDAVMHQVINHYALVGIRNDWENGFISDSAAAVGIIQRDMRTNTVEPFEINLQKGSRWKGLTGMFALGMEHIRTGTDHLLFLITLLLPACLLVFNRRWASYGGFRYSIARLLKIVTAFTVGHSVTLLIGVLGVVRTPSGFVEIAIALSIFVSAIHAIKPLFYGREMWIALGFGLIHGLAFSQTLQHLHLVSTDLVLSVLGFNLGIEVMQLAVICITIPWFVLMSQTRYFRIVRPALASVIAAAALGLIVQRATGDSNVLGTATDQLMLFSVWPVLGLCLLSLVLWSLDKIPVRRWQF